MVGIEYQLIEITTWIVQFILHGLDKNKLKIAVRDVTVG